MNHVKWLGQCLKHIKLRAPYNVGYYFFHRHMNELFAKVVQFTYTYFF